MLHSMIMAGGGGTRFWPRSRTARPKQFLTFSGDRTLLQGTFDRTAAPIPAERTWVITAAAHVDEARRQLPDVPPDQIVGEPVGRDTAACVGLGAALIAKADPDATIIVNSADHVIEPEREFQRAVRAAETVASEHPDSLLTFGIPPAYPAVGYGYIRRGEPIGERQGVPVYRVAGFEEKPDAERAGKFVSSGDYFWNSGIFVWKAATILGELERAKPDLHAAVRRIADAWGSPGGDVVLRKEYEAVEKISIDYAVMQPAGKAGRVVVLQAPYQWDDVGSWLALERRNPQDADGNTVQGEHVGIETANCVVVSDADHLIATIGVRDLLIVQAGDATLVADRKDEATVKQIVEQLKQTGRAKFL